MDIIVTPVAAQYIARALSRRTHGIGIRIGVRTTGCSGLAYQLEYVDVAQPDDIHYETENIHVWLDPKSLAYIKGTTLDFVKNGLNQGLEFKNPNERDRCGCGESFRV